ncbi:ComF family protein [Amycolatopsis nigrescens]|uniref:ComF family protein n=1 Tax=Amycolatopsis nigrescens TaxID=381445 RepID=UPI000367944B|nr:ComF family protein [Amycolatopsis nigrescens]
MPNLLRGTLDLLLPSNCAGCGAPGAACCPDCLAAFRLPRPVSRGPTAGVVPVYALAAYRGVARRLVLAYKERGRRDLAGPLGAALAGVLPNLSEVEPSGQWWLVPVPSRRTAARKRGGQHLTVLAHRCAAALAAAGRTAAVAPALRLRSGARDAVGLTPEQRAANLAGRLLPARRGLPPPGSAVVLLDDVVTTGATIAAGTAALAAAGYRVSAALTLTAAG